MTEYARRSIVDRMKGAAMLDIATYEEVEHDTEATGQAAVVVSSSRSARPLARSGAAVRRSLPGRSPRCLAGCCGRR